MSEAIPKPARVSATPTIKASTPGDRKLPTLDSLVQEMVDSLGGEKALRAHQHRTLTGKTEFVGLPMKGDFVQKASAPDKSLVVMHLGDLLVRQGVRWDNRVVGKPMNGLQIMKGRWPTRSGGRPKFYGPLDLVASNKEVTPAGFVSFDNKECIELKLLGESGDVSYLYVDAATYLIAGSKATIETPIAAVESKTYLRDYKDLNGYKTATEIFLESSVATAVNQNRKRNVRSDRSGRVCRAEEHSLGYKIAEHADRRAVHRNLQLPNEVTKARCALIRSVVTCHSRQEKARSSKTNEVLVLVFEHRGSLLLSP